MSATLLRICMSVTIFRTTMVTEIMACHCPQTWSPVCATDSQLYSTTCFFHCARIFQPNLQRQAMDACGPIDSSTMMDTVNEIDVIPSQVSVAHTSRTISTDPLVNSRLFYHPDPACAWHCNPRSKTTHIRVCDDFGTAYPSECEFYREVCRAEMHGFLLRRAACCWNYSSLANRRHMWWK